MLDKAYLKFVDATLERIDELYSEQLKLFKSEHCFEWLGKYHLIINKEELEMTLANNLICRGTLEALKNFILAGGSDEFKNV